MHRYLFRRSPGEEGGAPPPVAPPAVVPPAVLPVASGAPGEQPGPIPYARFAEVNQEAQRAKSQMQALQAQLDAANMRTMLMANGVNAGDLDEAAAELLDRWQRSAGTDGAKPDLKTWVPEVKAKKFAQAYFKPSDPAAPPVNGAIVPNLPPPAGNPNGGAAGAAPAAVNPYTPDKIGAMSRDDRLAVMADIWKAEVAAGRIRAGGPNAAIIERAFKALGMEMPK